MHRTLGRGEENVRKLERATQLEQRPTIRIRLGAVDCQRLQIRVCVDIGQLLLDHEMRRALRATFDAARVVRPIRADASQSLALKLRANLEKWIGTE